MKNVIFSFLLGLLSIGGYAQSAKQPIKILIKKDLNLAIKQYKYMMQVLPEKQVPKSFDESADKLITSEPAWWCSGFYPGTLWYLYEYSNDNVLKNEAERMLGLLKNERYKHRDHDLGFKIFCSYGNGYRLTGDTAYKNAIITAAKSLSTRYRPSIHSLQSWDKNKNFECPVIIDNMMNLELLQWAGKQTNNAALINIANNHANSTLKNHFRKDYSTWHVLDYDLAKGNIIRKATWQGFSDSSAWARGQAWALYGFTMMYRFTKNEQYLTQAHHIARFILNNPNMPADMVPFWDFNAPGIPNVKRDASSASIMASALLELGTFTKGKQKEVYRKSAETMIRSLSTKTYLAAQGTNGGFILKHSVGALPLNVEVDVPLTYADYYFVEALMRYRKWYLK